jgi:outer membrane cobalamin receptor
VLLGWAALVVLTAAPRAARAAGPEYDVYVGGGERVAERVGTARVIDAAEIGQRSARTLDEALRFEPGVYVRTGSDATPRIDVRGLRSRHVLLLLDGIPFNSTEDGQFDPAWIPTELMEEVRVQYGNSSTLYGDGPLAGVFQIVTRSGEAGVQGSLGSELREDDQYLGRFTASGARDRLDFFVSGSALGSHGFPLSDDFDPTPLEDGGERENSDRERGNLFAKLGFTPSETTRVGLLVTGFEGEFGLPPSTIDGDDFAQRARFERVEDADGISGQASMQYAGTGPFELRSWFYVNQLEEERHRYDDDGYDSMDDATVSGTFRLDGESRVSGGAFHGGLDLGRAGRRAPPGAERPRSVPAPRHDSVRCEAVRYGTHREESCARPASCATSTASS